MSNSCFCRYIYRFEVNVDVATALVYLHTECEERIIHRDVKAANVMLDAKFNARLGDFGFVWCYNHSLLTPESTNVADNFGYLALELFHTDDSLTSQLYGVLNFHNYGFYSRKFCAIDSWI